MAANNQNNQYQDIFKFFNSGNNSNIVDFSKVAEVAQRSAESLNQIQKAWFDTAQKVAKTNSEFLQEQAQTAANIATKALSAQSPEATIDAHTRFAQHAIDAGLQNAQNTAKQITDTQVKVFDILNKQAVDNINELSKSAKKAS